MRKVNYLLEFNDGHLDFLDGHYVFRLDDCTEVFVGDTLPALFKNILQFVQDEVKA